MAVLQRFARSEPFFISCVPPACCAVAPSVPKFTLTIPTRRRAPGERRTLCDARRRAIQVPATTASHAKAVRSQSFKSQELRLGGAHALVDQRRHAVPARRERRHRKSAKVHCRPPERGLSTWSLALSSANSPTGGHSRPMPVQSMLWSSSNPNGICTASTAYACFPLHWCIMSPFEVDANLSSLLQQGRSI